MSDIIKNQEYFQWLGELKDRIQKAQYKAAVKVNTVLIELYWSIGTDIVNKKIESTWGSGVIAQLSADLREAFPNMKGFSTTNLWYIKKWFLFYSNLSDKGRDTSSIKLQQLVGEMKMPQIIGQIPWGHNILIITKCKTTEEAIFYTKKVIQEGWSRAQLSRFMSSNLYASQGKAITNFDNHLPSVHSALAKETLKDPYNFDFLTLYSDYKERELEDALTQNITKFLLELGTGFAFVGRQVEIIVSNRSFYIDMLFYHIKLKCYIVVELKTVDFEPEFAGKLNFYVTAVDRHMRESSDKPTIGLLICKTKDDILAEYALADIQKPVGVSSYELSKILPKNLELVLPSVEKVEIELAARLSQETIE